MRVFALKILREFWESPQAPQGAEEALLAWYKVVERAKWRNFAELRAHFRSTDKVGDCYVFDIMNNDIRLIAYVRYTNEQRSGAVYIRQVLTHPEYDENKWPDECGCHKPRKEKQKGPRPVKQPRTKRRK